MHFCNVFLIPACLVFFYTKIGYGQDLPKITKTIWPEVKRVGMTGYLNCTVARQTVNKVFWVHKESQTVITSDDKIMIDMKLNAIVDGYPKYDVKKTIVDAQATAVYTLIIRRLEERDTGQYTCQIVVRGGTGQVGGGSSQQDISKDGNLTVLVPPNIIQGSVVQNIHVEEGSSANLSCMATGYPKPNITWVRANGKQLPAPHFTYTHRGENLYLSSLSKMDQGVFRCIANNDVRPPAPYDTTLYVDFQPTAIPVQTTYGQSQNKLYNLIIECIVSGFPQPDLKWYKGTGKTKVPLSDSYKYKVNQLLNYGDRIYIYQWWLQLVIYNVQGDDLGYYTCEGSNYLGNGTAIVQVYETSECQGPTCPAGARYPSQPASTAIDQGDSACRMVSPSLLLFFLVLCVLALNR